MGFFSGWKDRQAERFRQQTQPYNEALKEIWRREIERLGETEFHRRQSAVAAAQLGRTGPSGFEDWGRQLQAEIEDLALRIAARQQ